MNALRQLSTKWRTASKVCRSSHATDCYCYATRELCADELDKLAQVVEPMAEALRAIANRAGAPTMSYAPEIERREQRESLDWIAAKCAEVLATFEKESADDHHFD